jgi:hypothetical protein
MGFAIIEGYERGYNCGLVDEHVRLLLLPFREKA